MFILHKYAYMSFHPSMIELRIVIQLAYIMIWDTHCQMHNNSMENLIHILCILYTTSQKRVVFGSKRPIKTPYLLQFYNNIQQNKKHSRHFRLWVWLGIIYIINIWRHINIMY